MIKPAQNYDGFGEISKNGTKKYEKMMGN